MKVSTGFLAVIQAGSYFREFQKNRQKCPRRSGKTITFSDLQTTRRMNRPSEVRMPGGDFAASCCARWSFVISRKLIFPYPPGGEKSGISEIYGFSRFSRSPPYGHRPPFGLPALFGRFVKAQQKIKRQVLLAGPVASEKPADIIISQISILCLC